MTLARKPLVLVEIDVDRCTRTYGSAPCTAALSALSPNKCFNGFATCQDPANFERGSVTLTFAQNQTGLPKTGTVFPALVAVSGRSAEINLSGIDPKTSPLGRRATITVELEDFAYDDALTDPYRDERRSGAAQFSGVGYDPAQRSTFFRKHLARVPYYQGRSLRVRRGYVGDAPSAMATSHYVITGWSGPDAGGRVTIEASDPLNLIDGKRSQLPEPSPGKLLADIGAGAGSAELTPAGIGDSDYPASGLARIGRELVRFTRSGDTLTLTERGAERTEAKSHDALDQVQVAIEYVDERGCDIIADLLSVKGPVDPASVPLATWQALYDEWYAGLQFSGIISEPTSVAELVGELLQFGMQIWWDELAGEMRFEVNRFPDSTEFLPVVSDAAGIIRGSAQLGLAEGQRATAIFFYHGVIDPTDALDEGRNYKKVVIAKDGSAASQNEYGESAIKKIYCRWFGRVGNDAAASIIAERLISRFRDTPLVLSVALDAKDASIELADLLPVQCYLLPSPTGEDAQQIMQVAARERRGDTIVLRAQSFNFVGRFARYMVAPQADYDAATEAERYDGAFYLDDAIEDDFGDGLGPYLYF